MMWGRPNSVTMVATAQMAADVELANFLTRKYFEKTCLRQLVPLKETQIRAN